MCGYMYGTAGLTDVEGILANAVVPPYLHYDAIRAIRIVSGPAQLESSPMCSVETREPSTVHIPYSME